ncbi:MAG TPA: DUF2520 domain-containing protein, partial [Thermoanaerobaculia bacterium]|nr:DUF2520 domain-containing protein [Thermoanaerobaculia bacterium]
GLPPEVARGYLELARGTVAAAIATPAPGAALAAITGPVARGDLATVQSHFEALKAAAPECLDLARELARETLRQVATVQEPSPGHRALMAWLDQQEPHG